MSTEGAASASNAALLHPEMLPLKIKGGSFWLRAELGCDYVIHQGRTIKEEEEAMGGRVCERREAWNVIMAALMVIV